MIGTIIIIELYKYIIVRRYWMLEKLLPVTPLLYQYDPLHYVWFERKRRERKRNKIFSEVWIA